MVDNKLWDVEMCANNLMSKFQSMLSAIIGDSLMLSSRFECYGDSLMLFNLFECYNRIE